MIDIPKIEYAYAQRIDWSKTVAGLKVGDPRICELTQSQYVMMGMARKELRKNGIECKVRHIYATNLYIVERVR